MKKFKFNIFFFLLSFYGFSSALADVGTASGQGTSQAQACSIALQLANGHHPGSDNVTDKGCSEICKVKVEDLDFIEINELSLSPKHLGGLGIGRKEIFEALKAQSIPETQGCWASATGDFDHQFLSVGVLQWNFGQNSLQRILRTYKTKVGKDFSSNIGDLMPKYGKQLLFSAGCLKLPSGKNTTQTAITKECQEHILALQDGRGRLYEGFKNEVNTLFNTKEMIQLQVDEYVKRLDASRHDLKRLFSGKKTPTFLQIKWMTDFKVQQGNFFYDADTHSPGPNDRDIEELRKNLMSLRKPENAEKKKQAIMGILTWYEGLSRSASQQGTRLDWDWNSKHWGKMINSGAVTDEQMELLYLSFLRCRLAAASSGLYQANAFQRRATIVLGVGSLSGRRVGVENQAANGNPVGWPSK